MFSHSRNSFLERSLRYERLHVDPCIRARTTFFGAAAAVTRVFAMSAPSAFLDSLSAALAVANEARAARIRAGLLYVDGTVESNTADFIRLEQRLIETELVHLLRMDRAKYRAEISAANRYIRYATLWGARCGPRAHRHVHMALRLTGMTLGHLPNLATRRDREMIGCALAAEVARERELASSSGGAAAPFVR